MATSNSPPAKTGRHQRSIKNLLLDKHFQLKYTGYLVAIAFVLSISLGFILWRTSERLVDQSMKSAVQGEQIVSLGKEVVGESRKVSAVVRMNIVKDPIYQDDPDLLAAFNSDADEQDAKLDAQTERLEQQRAALATQAKNLQNFHRTMLFSLAGLLTLLVLGIGAAGIVVTHKVAGPIFKMKRHLGEVALGKYQVPWSLRKGDELVDFFESFRKMVVALRDEREAQMKVLQESIDRLGDDQTEVREALSKMRSDMEKSIS